MALYGGSEGGATGGLHALSLQQLLALRHLLQQVGARQGRAAMVGPPRPQRPRVPLGITGPLPTTPQGLRALVPSPSLRSAQPQRHSVLGALASATPTPPRPQRPSVPQRVLPADPFATLLQQRAFRQRRRVSHRYY
jgi:hypothetical protein